MFIIQIYNLQSATMETLIFGPRILMRAWVEFMLFIATFNNISVISLRSVLLMEATGVPGKTTDLPQVTVKSLYMLTAMRCTLINYIVRSYSLPMGDNGLNCFGKNVKMERICSETCLIDDK